MNAADELIGAFDEGADSDEIHARKGKKKINEQRKSYLEQWISNTKQVLQSLQGSRSSGSIV